VQQSAIRTPFVRLNADNMPSEIFLKLENLQPTGSFKVRGVSNALTFAGVNAKKNGVYTCSAGNMAQALAYESQRRGIDCTVVVPDNAAQTKLAGIRRYGGKIVQTSFDELWQIVTTNFYRPLKDKVFIHPFMNPHMITGNGTIGLEILEDMPDVETILVPFGGGGLAAGIATAVRAEKPSVKVYGVEPETAAPLAESFKQGYAMEVNRIPSFVDGIGAKSVLPEMWNLVKPLLQGSIVVSLREVASAIRTLVERNRIVAEGAGAAATAAALSGRAGNGKTVAIVSGGNIDSDRLVRIIQGEVPK
jgi:threonine dehydratase